MKKEKEIGTEEEEEKQHIHTVLYRIVRTHIIYTYIGALRCLIFIPLYYGLFHIIYTSI